MPLCNPASSCPFYYNIAGSVHSDTSASCALDSLYPGAAITNLKVMLMQGAQVVQQFYTAASGNYSFEADSLVNYTVTVDTTGLPLIVVCPGSGVDSLALSPADSVVTGVNFGMLCLSFDYGAEYIWGRHFRPTYTGTVHIGVGNIALIQHSINCGLGMSGTVTTTLSGSITYAGPAPGALTPTSVSGSTLTYAVSDLDLLIWGSLDIIVLTDTGAVVGSQACLTTIVTPSVPDYNPNDDTLTECFTIVHSWDPNEKDVSPAAIYGSPDWLTYTVAFQNTGTDTAYLIVVRDTLSPYVDASTFQYVASSAKPVIQLMGSAVVFTFPNINLVDSATNPALSEGWVQYRVKSKPNLPSQTQITNTAYIFFDQNPAIVTNTAVTTVEGATGTGPVQAARTIALYPNPNRGSFTLQTSGSTGISYSISDMLGNVILTDALRSSTQTISLPDAADGVYTLSVKGAPPHRFAVVR